MIFKLFRLALFFLFFASCEEKVTSTSFTFPTLKLISFQPRVMELGTGSYISQTQKNSISLAVSWEKIENSSNLDKLRIYLDNGNGTAVLIDEKNSVNSISSFISDSLKYDEDMNFSMSVVTLTNEESPTNKSNTVSLRLSYGEPDKIVANFVADSLNDITLTWEVGKNGSDNVVFNVDHQLNGLLDSISVNVEKSTNSENTEWEKILSLFGASRKICVDEGTSGETRPYRINIKNLKNMVKSSEISVLKDFDSSLFSASNIDNLFISKGNYRVSFYLYKKKNGQMNIHRTEFLDNIQIN